MTAPKGWEDYDVCLGESNRPVHCGSCDWKGFEDDVEDGLWGINDIEDRLSVGSVVPVGECPATIIDAKVGSFTCGSLTYYSDVEIVYRRTPTVLDQIVEAVEAAE